MKNFLGILLSIVLVSSCAGERNTDLENDLSDSLSTSISEQVDNTVYPKSWDDIANNELEPNKKITIEGYLAEIGTYVDMSFGLTTIHIYPKRNQTMGQSIFFSMPIGSGANQVHELPEEFLPEDFKVVDVNKQIMTAGAKVRVTLRVEEGILEPDDYMYDFISIEQLDDEVIEESIFDKAIELTNKQVSDTVQKEIYAYMDGSFELPFMVFKTDGKIRLTFKNKTNKEVKSIAVLVGDGPSSMNDLPDDFTDKDLIIRDYKGDPITGSRVRVFGTWYQSEYSNTGSFYLEEIMAL